MSPQAPAGIPRQRARVSMPASTLYSVPLRLGAGLRTLRGTHRDALDGSVTIAPDHPGSRTESVAHAWFGHEVAGACRFGLELSA
jgi:hypothetical protein